MNDTSTAIIMVMALVLDDAAVAARLDPRTAVTAMREALIAAYRDELLAPPRVHACRPAPTTPTLLASTRARASTAAPPSAPVR